MNESDLYKNLMYEHEVLWAKYEIREHYLQNIVQEIYENIGQVLSLVRVKLVLLSGEHAISKEDDQEPGSLIGQAIHDLRNMCRNFYPETEVLKKLGLAKTLEYELKLLGIDKKSQVQTKGKPYSFSVGTELIILCMLQEIFTRVAKQHAEHRLKCKIQYSGKHTGFYIEYTGDPLTWHQPAGQSGLTRLALPERVALIGGKLQVKNITQNMIQIKLKIPFKHNMYDF